MASTWKSLTLPAPPQELRLAAEGLESAAGAVVDVLGILKSALEALSSVQVVRLSAVQLLVKEAVAVIDGAIENLLNTAGAYVLLVPVRKKVVVSPLIREALEATGVGTLPRGTVDTNVLGLQAYVSSKGALESDPVLASYFRNTNSAEGGNAGFIRTVVESLADLQDPNRPVLDETMYVTGVYALAGAPDYLSLLSFITGVASLLGARNPSHTLDVPGEPVPQNLRARCIASGDGGSRLSAMLEWTFQQPVVSIPSLGMTAMINRVCVVRSKSPSLLTKVSVQDIFGTKKIRKGLATGTGDDAVEVIDVYDYDGVNLKSTYIDRGLDKNTTYYYAVGFDYSAGSAGDVIAGSAKPAGFRTLSNVTKVYCQDPAPRSSGGTPPDWYRTPSALDIVPDLGQLARELSAIVRQLGDLGTGYAELLKAHIQFIEQEINSYVEYAAGIAASLQRLGELSQIDTGGGAYLRRFDGLGGNLFLVQDLVHALSPSNPDRRRPPFDRGDEFVTGAVILAASPTLAGLAPVKTMLDLLFGDLASGREKSIVEAAIEGIDRVLSEAEAEESASAPVSRVSVGLNDDGSEDLNCPPPLDRDLDFADDFSIR